MSLREHSKTLFFTALFVTKCVSIVIERKQSFRFSFSKVCTYFRCGAVFDILKVIFREKNSQKRNKNKQKKILKITSWKLIVWRGVKIPVRTTTMASRLMGREKKDENRIHSAPVTPQRNSKIPIRLTRLSSVNHEGFSFEDKTVKKRPFPKNSGKKRSSRIPVAVNKTGTLNFCFFVCHSV